MSEITQKVHDKFFKKALQNKDVARSFLEGQLPQSLLTKVDLTHIEIVPNTFIDETFESYESDILFCLKTYENKDCFVYILIEHQSTKDEYIVLRLANYWMKVLMQYHKDHPKAKLPLIYPAVVYTGGTKWENPQQFYELFLDVEHAKEYIHFYYRFVDVSQLEADARQGAFGFVSQTMNYRRYRRGLDAYLKSLLLWLKEYYPEPFDEDFVIMVSGYLMQVLGKQNREILMKAMKEYVIDGVRIPKNSIAASFIEEGVEEGIIKGRQEGRLEERKEIVKALLAKGFSIQEIGEIVKIDLSELQQIAANDD